MHAPQEREHLERNLSGLSKSQVLDLLLEWKSGASLQAALVRHGLVSPQVARFAQQDGDHTDSTLLGSSAVPTTGGSVSDTGRYHKLRSHARGGLGEVFVAVDTELQREVALKEIQAHRTDDAESRHRFVREAQVTGRLEHPGIVPVYGLGSDDKGRPYYAMRFVQGKNLEKAIKEYHTSSQGEKTVGLRRLLGRFVAMCQAVGFAHSKGVIHRDLKPANVMLGEFGETLVVDWGLAKASGVASAPRATLASGGREPPVGGAMPGEDHTAPSQQGAHAQPCEGGVGGV